MNPDEDSPPPLPPQVPIEIGPVSGIRPRRNRRGSSFIGRLWLVAFFIMFYSFDAFMYFNAPLEGRPARLGLGIAANLWTTALLIGVWMRHSWARTLLIILIFLRVVGEIIYVPSYLEHVHENATILKIIAVFLTINVFIAAMLMVSRDIRRLTNRQWE